MAVAYACVLIAAIIPIVFAAYAKFSVKGYDNSKPREFLASLDGRGKRANYVQLNSWEAFPVFASAVIIAHLSNVSPVQITVVSVAFIVFRVLYGILYILDYSALRSAAWFGGFSCIACLFISAIMKA